MKEKTIDITNFIGVYDNYVTEQECDVAIKLYEEQDKFHNTLNRGSTQNKSVLKIHNKYTIEYVIDNLKKSEKIITLGKRVKINFVKDRPGHDIRYALNSNKIKKKLKWKNIYIFERKQL